ncbi:16S rRNA (cytosine1402-N4)-methyltransferase [Rhodoligotrophos appendicifer]|uniref:16S rRNA (cytosine(1402)-N(4))-methyltransferase RsmH n=1 Tax=Rhodoligotrophos appendicifer TaxID=987056 RepID=UPI001184DD69|nr:16S rRNA (cytosine(1402)-N(4))-methyltransferase RsmH [Rhodoligotrophos appendicifer]
MPAFHKEQMPSGHVPVLLAEVMAALAPKASEIFIDGTFGAGGYSRALLEVEGTTVIAIDRDPTAIAAGQPLLEKYPGRLSLLPGRFAEMAELVSALGVSSVDGVTLDVGVSSMQLDQAERGFSFMQDGPLDMRMGGEGMSAADVVAEFSETALANVIFTYGEERKSRPIARAIVKARSIEPIARTVQLAEIVERALGGRRPQDRIHPATRTFQALRIFVNDELGELARGLGAAERLLRPGGRLAVVSFHSLEDRIVKRFFADRTGRSPRTSRHAPEEDHVAPSFEAIGRGVISASEAEARDNPRARSAKLRAGCRTSADAIPLDAERLGMKAIDREALSC